MSFDGITVKGAREHNLKNIDVQVPRNQITVITGLSGSGKSTLAFDTIYAEGQRRYLEGLSSYARNFLEQLKKPDVDSITGLSPAISIEQKTSSNNPRSTVGTVTETYDYMRLMFAKIGRAFCPKCKTSLQTQTHEEIIDEICNYKKGSKLILLAPVANLKKGTFKKEFEQWQKMGFVRAKINGTYYDLDRPPELKKTVAQTIDLVVDKIIIKPDIKHRISQSVSKALELSRGQILVEDIESGEKRTFSQFANCPGCSSTFPEVEPLLFSFNSPKGACPKCNGIGSLDLIPPEEDEMDDDSSDDAFDELAIETCPKCKGSRLKPEALNIHVGGKNIFELSSLSIKELLEFLKNVDLSDREKLISEKLFKLLSFSLDYMIRVGVSYLSLHRSARTLSGGESQRIRLASQIGSGLIGVLYVLDEPSIGLHPQDHKNLLGIIDEICKQGNTIILVEHDEETILRADLIIDLGPGAGVQGGAVQATGSPKELKQNPASLTGAYLSGKKKVFQPAQKRDLSKAHFLEIHNATGNNLKDVSVKIPFNAFTSVAGVSGSGKSTLIIDTLFRFLSNKLNRNHWAVSPVKSITGVEKIDSIVNITQKPIGRTPRSNPATYTGLFTLIRNLFAEHPESKIRGFKPGYFSFNVKGGRCENCSGAGMRKVEMNFLADVYVECDVCQGRRYNAECLSIRYKDKNIADILEMDVSQAVDFFAHHKLIFNRLKTLERVGLTYIKLGQSSTTLSGGEAQRVKLSKELAKRAGGHILYILDEPTTGLHFEDVSKLLELLHELVDNNNTVLVIEHNLDVIRSSDYVIEMGPEGGPQGGHVLNASDYANFLKNKKSMTAPFLR